MKEFERLDTKLDLLKYLPSRYKEKARKFITLKNKIKKQAIKKSLF